MLDFSKSDRLWETLGAVYCARARIETALSYVEGSANVTRALEATLKKLDSTSAIVERRRDKEQGKKA